MTANIKYKNSFSIMVYSIVLSLFLLGDWLHARCLSLTIAFWSAVDLTENGLTNNSVYDVNFSCCSTRFPNCIMVI